LGRDENDCRVPFSPLEAVAMGRALEELEKPKAQERQSVAGKERGRGKIASGKFTEAKQTRDIVGEAIGVSGMTYQRAKAVAFAGLNRPKQARAGVATPGKFLGSFPADAGRCRTS